MNKPKQIIPEPLEMLKTVREQVTGVEALPTEEHQPEKLKVDPELAQKMQTQGQRQLEALNREIKDIAKQRLLKDLQERINQGEEINLAGLSDLTSEEREVLMTQMQAVKTRQQMASGPMPLVQPASKPDRKFAGEGLGAKRMQTHVEKLLPSSG